MHKMDFTKPEAGRDGADRARPRPRPDRASQRRGSAPARFVHTPSRRPRRQSSLASSLPAPAVWRPKRMQSKSQVAAALDGADAAAKAAERRSVRWRRRAGSRRRRRGRWGLGQAFAQGNAPQPCRPPSPTRRRDQASTCGQGARAFGERAWPSRCSRAHDQPN